MKTLTTFSHEGFYYRLYYANAAFTLTARPPLEYLKKQYGETAYLFIDDESVDDLGVLSNPFVVIRRSIEAMVRYVFDERLSYFYFASSTDRKNKIYEWLAKKLVAELELVKARKSNKHWQYSWHNGRFYFWLG